jgi:ribokinase
MKIVMKLCEEYNRWYELKIRKMSIIVFGSINMDLVATVPRLPVAGETLLGRDFFNFPGGKGANQAVASARLGIPTYMVGRVGADNFGTQLINSLKTSGVYTENIFVDETLSSGVAIIAVDDTGENQIIVIPGANGRVNHEDIGRMSHLLPEAKVLLLQFEIPMPTVISAAIAAQSAGLIVILDPAPVEFEIPEELYSLVNIITPNEVEAEQLVGFPVHGEESAREASVVLRQRGVKCAIIKLGAKGALCNTPEETFFVKAFPVDAIDTTAAGDAFNGGLAAALVEGYSLREAVVWGAAAGALATTKPGAQPSLPDRLAFDTFIQDKLPCQNNSY